MLYKNNVVLIVDDSYTIRHQVRMLLKKINLTVVEAYDYHSMQTHLFFNHKPVDLIIMDLGLKKETGFELMEYIRGDALHRETPIIVLTGNAKKDAVIASSPYDIMFYAIKPINPKDLLAKVLAAIESKNADAETPEEAVSLLDQLIDNDSFDPFSIKDLDKKLKTTPMGQFNQALNTLGPKSNKN